MKLDEAIERYTRNAEYERTHGSLQGCMDFRQLAEWMKDYKRLLEQEPTGHWTLHNEGYFDESYVCSKCDGDSPFDYKYCPNCGANMGEEI